MRNASFILLIKFVLFNFGFLTGNSFNKNQFWSIFSFNSCKGSINEEIFKMTSKNFQFFFGVGSMSFQILQPISLLISHVFVTYNLQRIKEEY